MVNILYNQNILFTIFKFTDNLYDLLMFGLLNRYLYCKVLDYIFYNKSLYKIPKKIEKQDIITHIIEKHFISKCYKCLIYDKNLTYSFQNFKLKICNSCLGLDKFYFKNIFHYNDIDKNMKNDYTLIKNIKGFTRNEIIKFIKNGIKDKTNIFMPFFVDNFIHSNSENIYLLNSEIKQATIIKYGHESFETYCSLRKEFIFQINEKIKNRNINSLINSSHCLTQYLVFPYYKNDIMKILNKKDISEFNVNLKTAILRYCYCKEIEKNNHEEYNKSLNLVSKEEYSIVNYETSEQRFKKVMNLLNIKIPEFPIYESFFTKDCFRNIYNIHFSKNFFIEYHNLTLRCNFLEKSKIYNIEDYLINNRYMNTNEFIDELKNHHIL